VTGAALDGRIRSHPAVAAWVALGHSARVPTLVETLKDRTKTSVYRLRGAGPEGGDVVAKRTRRPLARREHLLCVRVLPRLGLPALRSHGWVDIAPDRSWVFVDHCPGSPFEPADPAHRRLAADWFARMHARGVDAAADAELGDRSLDAYHARLGSIRTRVRQGRVDPVPGGVDRGLLAAVETACDALEAGWGAVEAACRPLPPTLVHGDAVPKNLLVRSGPRGPEIVPIDWAEAGRGPAVVDLPHVDGPAYWAAIGADWGVGGENHERLQAIGSTLLWLVAIEKVCRALTEPSYADRAADQLGWFLAHVRRSLPAIGAGRGARS
jgi:Phosphotransferase enzyme family